MLMHLYLQIKLVRYIGHIKIQNIFKILNIIQTLDHEFSLNVVVSTN